MHTRTLTTAFLATVLVVTPALGQNLVGRVVDAESEQPLEGVRVVLLDGERNEFGGTFTDDAGRFVLAVPRSGEWLLSATLIGYGRLITDPVPVDPGERVAVEVRLGVEAVPLEALVVTGRSAHMNPDIQSFYRRLERGGRAGIGRFVAREDIERSSPSYATDLLRTMPGMRVVRGRAGQGSGLRMSSGCVPAIFIDGTQINRLDTGDSLDNYVTPQSIEGIEVYRGAGQQVGRFHDGRGCGLVLVWTRRGVNEGKPMSWKRLLVGASILVGIFLLR